MAKEKEAADTVPINVADAPVTQAQFSELAAAVAGLAEATKALMGAHAATPQFVGPNTPVSASVNARVKQILADAREKKAAPVDLDPGQAVICDKRGKNGKLVDAHNVMAHGNRVVIDGTGNTSTTGSHFHDVKEGHLIVQRFKPYPPEAVVEGQNAYFDFKALGYHKGPDGAYYHPIYGLPAMNRVREARGMKPITFEE